MTKTYAIDVKALLAPMASRTWLWALGLGLIFFCMRAIGMLGPASLRWMLPLGFIVMVALPWLVLAANGRRQIGLCRAKNVRSYGVGIVAGVLAASLCFILGVLLYGTSDDNWFINIANNYRQILDTRGFDLLKLHLMFTIPACLFSPFGEEIFFRGFLQRALESRFSSRLSTHIEAGLFGIVHLCHHGLIATPGRLSLRPVSGCLWVLLMFSTAWMFAWIKKSSGSIFPAIASHAAFNATMNVFIFAFLWHSL